MPTLAGMKPEGYYDRHSTFQRVTMEATIGWAVDAIGSMTLPEESRAITIADFGCSEGNNSIVAMGHLVNALRQRRPAQPICVIHCDLPSNNFNQLFLNLHEADQANYFRTPAGRNPDIVPLACGGSFFEHKLAPGSLHLATSFLAVEWMDRIPDVPVPEFIGCMKGSAAAKEAFARQADQDLTRFLEAREAELVPGGKLLVMIPGTDGSRSCSDGLYDVMNDAAVDLADAGRISRLQLERFVMPVYFRTLDELTAPVTRASSPLRKAFAVDRAETLVPPIPFEEEFARTGNIEAYAEVYTGFVRAFSEPVFTANLLEPGQDRSVIDELYERVRARLIAEPRRYTIRNVETAMLLTRR